MTRKTAIEELTALLQTLRFQSIPATAEAILKWCEKVGMQPPPVTEELPGGTRTLNEWER